jgi:hypothetical protein
MNQIEESRTKLLHPRSRHLTLISCRAISKAACRSEKMSLMGAAESAASESLELIPSHDKSRLMPVGFQNAAVGSEQRFQAAVSYSLIRPPRIGRRRILP